MKTFLASDYQGNYFSCLCYDNKVKINKGDLYVLDLLNDTTLCTCSSQKESDECNRGLEYDDSYLQIFPNINEHCYKVKELLSCDKDGYAKFWLSFERGVIDPWIMVIWMIGDQKPVYDPIAEHHTRPSIDSTPKFKLIGEIHTKEILPDIKEVIGKPDITKLYEIDLIAEDVLNLDEPWD